MPIGTGNPSKDSEGGNFNHLTARELNVVTFVSDGLTNKEIAWEIGVAEVTVKMHMRSICIKLHAKNRAHAAIIAAQIGLLQPNRFLA